MESLNVAFFASAFHPSLGGVEEMVRQLTHAIQARGHRAIVITNHFPESLPRYEEYEGIPIYRVAMRAPDELNDRAAHMKSLVRYWLTKSSSGRQIKEILLRHKSQLVHVHCASSNTKYASWAAAALHLPIILTTHGEVTMDAARTYQRSRVFNRWLREAAEAADFVTGCSQKTLDELQAHLRLSLPHKSKPIYNGVSFDEFESASEYSHPRPYALAVGRMVPQKGFDILLRAWAKIAPLQVMENYDLILAGDGSDLGTLEALADELGIGGRVLFPGRTDRARTVSLFKGCEFFVLPSRREPFGLVNLEAMAAGKPVVATRVGGVPEIVLHEQTGLLVPGEDGEALSGAILQLAESAPLREQLGAAGRRRAEQFSWPAIAEEYLNLYSQVLAGHEQSQNS